MTRILGELLGFSQPHFSALIAKLEQAAGRPSADIKITHDVAQTVRDTLRMLHLDSSDSTNQEIYAALRNKIGNDELHAISGLGLDSGDDISKTLASIQRFCTAQIAEYKVTVIRPSVLKKFLKKNPPKKAMKALNYRSIDSMLKHESIASLCSASWICESAAWRKKFLAQYKTLTPSDFEERSIEIFQPHSDRWKSLGVSTSDQRKHNILSFAELGVVTILPVRQYLPGLVMTNLMLTLKACNELIIASSYIKLRQVTPGFGHEVVGLAEVNNTHKNYMIGKEVEWSTLHAYFARQKNYVHYFDPYIQAQDLKLLNPEKIIASLHPALLFWQSIAHVMRSDKSTAVSFSLLDVSINYFNNLPYFKSVADTAKYNLWQELLMKYINQDMIESKFLPALQPVPQEIEPKTYV